MRREKCLRIIGGILAILAMTLILGGSAEAVTYKVLHVFTGSQDGAGPEQHLIFDAAGNLYGTTNRGGDYNNGTVYELSPQPDGTWAEQVLYSFTGGADGAWPVAALIFDAAGNLYSTTWGGGQYGDGVVFELAPNPDGTWTESVLHTFAGGDDGDVSWSALVFDAAGNLYGTAVYGGAYGVGIVFELSPDPDGTWTESILHTFTGGWDGSNPARALVFDAAGNLYGTAENGGAHGYGVVFELTPSQGGVWTESVLHSFRSVDGSDPQCPLVFDSLGRLYGTTHYGGSRGDGVVFILIPNSDGTWTDKVLHQFTGGNDGANPWDAVTLDAAGNVYGTTGYGGAYGDGVVFQLTPAPGGGVRERIIHTFSGSGADPTAAVIFDAAGNLYGTAYTGRGDGGLVFEMSP